MSKGEKDDRTESHLRSLKLRGSVAAWALIGLVVSAAGLFGLTGLASTPWLFLLYPALIGLLIASLGMLALHLIRHL